VDFIMAVLKVYDGSNWQSIGKLGGSTTAWSLTITIPQGYIGTGYKGEIVCPYACTIKGWYLTAHEGISGTGLVIDVWKKNNAIPTVADTICGTEKPTLSNQQVNSDTNLTTWTTTVNAGDVIAYNIDSINGISQFTLSIAVEL
jgi:hypothetical protein